jgi:hypothetical protein
MCCVTFTPQLPSAGNCQSSDTWSICAPFRWLTSLLVRAETQWAGVAALGSPTQRFPLEYQWVLNNSNYTSRVR